MSGSVLDVPTGRLRVSFASLSDTLPIPKFPVSFADIRRDVGPNNLLLESFKLAFKAVVFFWLIKSPECLDWVRVGLSSLNFKVLVCFFYVRFDIGSWAPSASTLNEYLLVIP